MTADPGAADWPSAGAAAAIANTEADANNRKTESGSRFEWKSTSVMVEGVAAVRPGPCFIFIAPMMAAGKVRRHS
jgi:hypothetical protein